MKKEQSSNSTPKIKYALAEKYDKENKDKRESSEVVGGVQVFLLVSVFRVFFFHETLDSQRSLFLQLQLHAGSDAIWTW